MLLSFRVDVHENTGRTLLFIVQMYGGGSSDIR